MKNYDDMNLKWMPMYKAGVFDSPFWEVLKIAPREFAVILIRHDTGECAITCVFPLKSMAEYYAKYKCKVA